MWGLCKRYGLCLWCPAPAGSPPQCLPSGPQVTSRVTEAAEALAALRAKANADLAELREARDSADQSVGRLAEAQRAAVADLNDRISRCVPPPPPCSTGSLIIPQTAVWSLCLSEAQ